MFISKKKYEELRDLAEGYKKSRDEKTSENWELRMRKKELEIKVESLEYYNNRLIEWVEKIINEVGCYKIDKPNPIQLPIYKYHGCTNGKTITKIVIPELTIFKTER